MKNFIVTTINSVGVTCMVHQNNPRHRVKTFDNSEDAYDLAHKLNNGYAFDGPIPDFFFIEAKRPTFEKNEH